MDKVRLNLMKLYHCQAKNWSWIDAIHMGINPYARLGNVTGDAKYLDKMFELFNQTAFTTELAPYVNSTPSNSDFAPF